MKLYTSYFYMLRFFKPSCIPLSTAMWDPKWYHAFQSQDYVFWDKRGVINGLRIAELRPGPTCENECRGPENCATKSPSTCPFLHNYLEQLRALDFDHFYDKLETVAANFKQNYQLLDEPSIIFMVHEAPTNPCSERVVIQQYFKEKGVLVPEWKK